MTNMNRINHKRTIGRFAAIIVSLFLMISLVPAECFAASSPGQPYIKTLKASSTSTSVTITWSKAANADGYSLYRATKENGTYTRIRSTTKTSYTDTGTSGDKLYYYKVKAYRYVNGKKVYGLVSVPKSVVTDYSKPPLKVWTSYEKSSNRIRISTFLSFNYATAFSPTTLVYSELKRPFASKKIFGVLEKNAVSSGTPTKSIYLKYDESRYTRTIHSTGSSSSDYKYMKLTTKYPSADFYLSALNNPLQGYDPEKDVLKFYIIFKNKSYVVRYDAVNGASFTVM